MFLAANEAPGLGIVRFGGVFVQHSLVSELQGTPRTLDDLGQVVGQDVKGDVGLDVGAQSAEVAVVPENKNFNFLLLAHI